MQCCSVSMKDIKTCQHPVGNWSAFGQHSACSSQTGLLGGQYPAGWACSTWRWQSRWAPRIRAWTRSASPGRRSTDLVPPWKDKTLKSNFNMPKSPDQGVALPTVGQQSQHLGWQNILPQDLRFLQSQLHQHFFFFSAVVRLTVLVVCRTLT